MPSLLPPLLLPDPHGHDFYTTFYVLAFALNLGMLVWEGRRRGYPMRSWLVLLACTTLAFILGTKLLALSGPEWRQLLARGEWPASEARTVLGGALAGTLTLLALRRPFSFGWHVFDAFTLPMCAALMVQSVGCLLTGCCFGHLTSGSWGLRYAPDTLPYLVQYARGLIAADAPYSLPVHPTQLYSLGLCAVVGLVLLATRRWPWPGGSRRLLHLGLLLAGRFLIEFWREPAGEQVGATLRTHGGIELKQVQWVLLVLVPLSLGAWGWRVRRGTTAAERVPINHSVRNLLAVAGLLALTAWLGPQALVLPEVLVIKGLLLAVLGLEAGVWLRSAASTRPRHVALPLGLASAVLVLTSQSPAPQPAGNDAPDSYFTFSVDAAQGAFDQDVTREATSGGCSGSPSPALRRAYYHRYAVRGGSLSYSTHTSARPGLNTYGLGVWAGHDHVGIRELDPQGPFLTGSASVELRRQLVSVNPYFERISAEPGRFGIGYRVGLHLGSVAYSATKAADDSLQRWLMAPEGMFWLGVRRLVYGQIEAGGGPLAPGNPTMRLALGSGLGSDRGQYIQAGFGHSLLPYVRGNGRVGFVSALLPLGRTGLWVQPYGATNFGRTHQVSVRLHYRLGVQ